MKEYLISSIAFWDTEKQSQMDIKGSSMEMRLEQFDVATKIAFKNLGGEGYGYKLYSLQHYSQYNSDLYGLESFVIRELVEKGWLGLICFLWMFYLLYSYAISEVNAQDKLIILQARQLCGILKLNAGIHFLTGVPKCTPLFLPLLNIGKQRKIYLCSR